MCPYIYIYVYIYMYISCIHAWYDAQSSLRPEGGGLDLSGQVLGFWTSREPGEWSCRERPCGAVGLLDWTQSSIKMTIKMMLNHQMTIKITMINHHQALINQPSMTVDDKVLPHLAPSVWILGNAQGSVAKTIRKFYTWKRPKSQGCS